MNNIFDLQWEILKKEIDINNNAIKQMHEFGKSIKNWTIIVWIATIGSALVNKEFSPYIIFITAIPLLFWFLEAKYRVIQSKYIYRLSQIKTFLNSESFINSKIQGHFIGFKLLDTMGEEDKHMKSYKKSTNLLKTFKFKTLYFFYGSLVIFTIVIWLYAITIRETFFSFS